MPFMSFSILGTWLRGLLSIAMIGLGIGLIRYWYQETQVSREVVLVKVDDAGRNQTVEVRDRKDRSEVAPPAGKAERLAAWRPGLDRVTAALAGGVFLISWSFVGGRVLPLLRRKGEDEPNSNRDGTVQRIKRPDGSELHVEFFGPSDAPPIVLTHGWGADGTEWYYLKKQLTDKFRLIVWDLPGLGLSKQPDNHDYSLEKLASDLKAVVELSGGKPVVLLGHSIGGMTTLTYAKLFPETLGVTVAGLVLVHTTYTNPIETTSMSGLYKALRKPLLEPLLHLTIWLSPLVWVMNWLSYLNGSTLRSTAKGGFAGTETRGQLEFASRFLHRDSPAVLARGMFGMLHYDATLTLSKINVPVLIIPGDLDSTCKPEASEFMHQAIPGSQLIALKPAKHMGLVEHNLEFSKAVAGFVDSCQFASHESPAARRTV